MADEPTAALATYEFDDSTVLAPTDDAGSYGIDINPLFAVGPKPHGGYLLGYLGRAAVAAASAADSPHPHVIAATATYLGAPDPGAATIETDVLRTGRSASHVRAVLRQDGRALVDTTLILGELPAPEDDAASPTWSALEPFDVAPRDACIRLLSENPLGIPVHINDRLDLRLDPATLGWAQGEPSGRGELRGWIEFPDGRPIDHLGLLLFLDSLPPATFDVNVSGWMPTMALTAYLRGLPAPGPLRIRMVAQQIGAGRVDEVCELWDSAGRLVGQATQLASIRYPEGTELPPFPR